MIITTTPTLEGHKIKEYKGVVTGEVVTGINFLKDFSASIRDIIGGRTSGYENEVINAREIAMSELQARAEALGANAVVGVSYSYDTMGQSNTMLMIAISGTAVVID